MGMSNQKGESYAVDDRHDTYNSMGAWFSNRLYDGLLYSYSAGHCHCRYSGQNHSGAKACVNDFII